MSAKPVQTAETDDVIVVDEPTATSAVVVESSDDDDDIAEVVLDTPAAASASADAPANAVTEAVTTVDLDPPADGSKAESTPIPVVDVDVVADAETISMDVSEETASKTTAPTISVIDSAPAVQQPKVFEKPTFLVECGLTNPKLFKPDFGGHISRSACWLRIRFRWFR